MRVGFALLSLLVMTACETKSKSLPSLTIHRKLRWIRGVTEHTVAFGVRGGFELADRDSLGPIGSEVGNPIYLREPASLSLVSDDPFPPTFDDIRSERVTEIIVKSTGGGYTATLNVPEPHHRVTGVHATCSAQVCAFIWSWSADEPPTVEAIDLATGARIAHYDRPGRSHDPGSAHATADIACYVYTTVSASYVDHATCEDMRSGKRLWQLDSDGVISLQVVVTKNYVVVLRDSGDITITLHDLRSGRELAGEKVRATLRSLHGSEYTSVPFSDHLLVSTLGARGTRGESPQIRLIKVTEVDIPTGKIIGDYKHKSPSDRYSNPVVVPIRPGHIALYGE
jgi:hypothetical protein